MKRSSTVQSGWQIFRWPLVLGIANLIGLGCALVGNGWLDALSWACLGGAAILCAVLYVRAPQ
ncbi:MAG: hypothetical protein ACJAXQ_001216 [Parvibaculaceae bacterium]|jgi:hypothetical protein|nr:hypothetical protein [Parvibaculaceae bacterium]